MSYVDSDALPFAATRQTWRTKSIRDLLAEIITANPKASDAQLLKKFVGRLREDDDYFLAAAEYAFDNALRALRRERPRLTAKQKAVAAKRKADDAAVHAKLVSQVKAKALLKLVMPNGKPLRACTGRECDHFGGWLKRLAAKVGPDQRVGDVLSESDVRAIYTEA